MSVVSIPSKAIIHANSIEEATILLEFMRDNGYAFGGSQIHIPEDVRWGDYDGGSCYNIERHKDILYASREYYEEEVDRFLGYVRQEDVPCDLYYIPEDPEWRFIPVMDFIAKCSGCKCNADEEDETLDLSAFL